MPDDTNTPYNRHASVIPAASLDIEKTWSTVHQTKGPGRPSKYCPELVEAMVSALVQGVSLEDLCDRDDMPHTDTIYVWMRKYPEFAERIEDARTYGTEALNQRAKSALMGGRYSTGDAKRDLELAKHIRWEIGKRNRRTFGDQVKVDLTSTTYSIAANPAVASLFLTSDDAVEADFDEVDPDEK